MLSPRKYQRTKNKDNNRLHIILAVIFLFAGAVILRLYTLQVLKYDLYIALASDQHQVYNQLEPERGRIFIQDGQDPATASLYPVATNKEFGLVYCVPSKVADASSTAGVLYEMFDKERIEAEVDKLLGSDDFFKSLEEEGIPEEDKTKIEEFKKIKRELEIRLRQDEKMAEYLGKLNKENDPYEPLVSKVPEEKLGELMARELPGIDYIMEAHRYYPEGNIGSHILGFVGYKEDGKVGRYGLEGFFNDELSGQGGSLKAERSAAGDLIIINDREYAKPKDGVDLVLTINRSIQFEACTKLAEAAQRYAADGGSVIVMEPKTGAILAMCSTPDYDPNDYGDIEDIDIYNNPAIFGQYEPGSIFKIFTIAAGLDQGVIKPDSTYEDKGFIMVQGWSKPIKNSDYSTYGAHGVVDMVTVLEASLNTGAIYVMQKTTPVIFADYVKNFGFGEKTGIELETEGVSDIRGLTRETIRPVEAATASFGQGLTATPIQVIAAYAAIANGGILMKPYLVSEMIYPDGEKQTTQPKEIRRVLSERTALLASGMLVNVVDGGHAVKAGVKGYFVAGKTGTAQVPDRVNGGYRTDVTMHTFVGFAPVDDPKFVMLVKLDHPKNAQYAASTAAPTFGELANFILNYYQLPKER